MNYVFTFIGEFGYELLNWQGVIRKWASVNKKEGDNIIICSRKGLDLLYDFADYYIDISDLKSLQTTVGDCYTSYVFLENTGPHLPRKDWKIHGRGGTSFQPVVDHFNENKNNYTALIYCTDGEAPAPTDCPKNTLWCLSSCSGDNDELPGHVIKLN